RCPAHARLGLAGPRLPPPRPQVPQERQERLRRAPVHVGPPALPGPGQIRQV
ncbi:hypothetical protein IWQ56_005213, partial [Coemansia nantahalensis]